MHVSLIVGVFLLPSFFSLKILGYAPIAYHSHANFIGKIADVLAEAGHEVVILSPVMHLGLPQKVSKHARFIYFHNTTIAKEFTDFVDGSTAPNLWEAGSSNPMAIIPIFHNITRFSGEMCISMAGDPGLLELLRNEHFDVAYSETVDRCPFALFHLAGITKFAVTQSFPALDAWEHVTGVPHFTSYVPTQFASSGDRMSFSERVWNSFDAAVFRYAAHAGWDEIENELIRLHPSLPHIGDIIARSSYFFLNGEPLIDFPRLVSRKMIDIGGISVTDKHEPLGDPFSKWMNERHETVLISFGTIMLSTAMPARFKASILETARRMPNVTFIWKYEKEEDNIAGGIPNLHTSTWVPQTDILHDDRLSLFVTLGGLGSINEAIFTGVPLVVLPGVGDQIRNAMMVERLGTGRILRKDDLGDVDKLEGSIREVLEDDTYREKAKKVSAMLASQPHPIRERLVSHFEFMAEFGPLDTLDHAGRTMGYVELFNLDIAAVAIVAFSALCFTVFFVLCKFISRILTMCKSAKKKAD